MPFSLVVQGYPTTDIPVAHVQGPILQAMFLHLIDDVDSELAQRLHQESNYRPYTLSPLGLVAENTDFQGYWLPRQHRLSAGVLCYVRVTLLDDDLFPAFSAYFLRRDRPTFRLGETQFVVTDVLAGADARQRWGKFYPYENLKAHASDTERRIYLRFLTPTSFHAGDVDMLLPIPRLVFRSYQKRFEEFSGDVFPHDFLEGVERYVGVSRINRLKTNLIKTKKVHLAGFVGDVEFQLDAKTPSKLVRHMNLLADYAFFCGTGRKTTVGMGQTMRSRKFHNRRMERAGNA